MEKCMGVQEPEKQYRRNEPHRKVLQIQETEIRIEEADQLDEFKGGQGQLKGRSGGAADSQNLKERYYR